LLLLKRLPVFFHEAIKHVALGHFIGSKPASLLPNSTPLRSSNSTGGTQGGWRWESMQCGDLLRTWIGELLCGLTVMVLICAKSEQKEAAGNLLIL
jgi:hypothetical protein